MKAILESLSLKLFFWLFLIMTATLAVFSLLSFNSISDVWVNSAYERAHQASDLIKRSTYHLMLLNRKDDIHQTIRSLAEDPDIASILVYDKNGTIIFSANDEEIGREVDMQAEACVLCHDSEEPLHSLPMENRTRRYRGPSGRPLIALINPIENEPACWNAACHAHDESKTILGVLDVKMSLSGLKDRLFIARQQLLGVFLVSMALLAMVSGLFIYRLIRVPVHELVKGARRVAAGDLKTQIKVKGRGPLPKLAYVFNQMTLELGQARDQLTSWSHRLEEKVAEKTEELGRTQNQVIQMEKMASLGKLAASVAHELNNPLAGILNYAKLIQRDLDEEIPLSDEEMKELKRYLECIQRESSRCGDIVRNLLLFAKSSELKLAPQSVNEVMERTVMVVKHLMELSSVEINMERLRGDDGVVCDANQVQQALLALLVNAIEAMPDGGKIRMWADRDESGISIEVQDSGVGISKTDQGRVFEPYFTTKDSTTGAGLGLSVVHGIVEKHGGNIQVTSDVGKGTRFSVWLPLHARKGSKS